MRQIITASLLTLALLPLQAVAIPVALTSADRTSFPHEQDFDFAQTPWKVLCGIKQLAVVVVGIRLACVDETSHSITEAFTADRVEVVDEKKALQANLPILRVSFSDKEYLAQLTQVGWKSGKIQRLPIWYVRLKRDQTSATDSQEFVKLSTHCAIDRFLDDLKKANGAAD